MEENRKLNINETFSKRSYANTPDQVRRYIYTD